MGRASYVEQNLSARRYGEPLCANIPVWSGRRRGITGERACHWSSCHSGAMPHRLRQVSVRGVYSPMRYNISTCCAVLAWPTTRGDSSRRAAAQTSHRQAVHVVVYQPRGPAYVPVPRHVEREPTRRPRARQAPASVYMRRKRTPPQCWERETGRPLCPSAVRLRPQSVSVPAEKENGKATKRSSPRAKRQIPNSTARHPKGKIARNSDSETGSVQRQEGSSLQMGPAASCVRV